MNKTKGGKRTPQYTWVIYQSSYFTDEGWVHSTCGHLLENALVPELPRVPGQNPGSISVPYCPQCEIPPTGIHVEKMEASFEVNHL